MIPTIYQCLAIAVALRSWRVHRLKVNRDYTPSKMMETASRLTQKGYAPRDFAKAEADLRTLAKRLQAEEAVARATHEALRR